MRVLLALAAVLLTGAAAQASCRDEVGAAKANVYVQHCRDVSPATYLNLMDQYRPCYQATKAPELGRRLRPDEFQEALRAAWRAGLTRLDRPGT